MIRSAPTREVVIFTMEMLKEGAVWSILEHHHSCERLVLLTVANEIDEILVIHS